MEDAAPPCRPDPSDGLASHYGIHMAFLDRAYMRQSWIKQHWQRKIFWLAGGLLWLTKERFYFYFWSFSDFSTRTGPIPHLDTTITNDQFRSPHTTAAFNPFSQPQGLRLGHWRRQTRVSRVKYHGRETACDVSWKSSSWSMLRSSIPRLVGT